MSDFIRDKPPSISGITQIPGNDCHVFERHRAPLCFDKPYFNHITFGQSKVLKQPIRMTPQMMQDRGLEATSYAGRRVNEVRRLQFEDKDRIKACLDRDRAIKQAQESKQQDKLRWWQTRAAMEERDLMRVLRLQNTRFEPSLLLNAKDIVNCNLTGCKLGDSAMTWVSTFIMQNPTLRRLSLQGNHITSEGMNNLYMGLRETTSLIDLDVSLNPIEDEGLHHLVSAFTENLRNTKIQKITLGTCNLTPSSCYHVARLVRDFKTLEFLLLWRNRLGLYQEGVAGGSSLGMVFDELVLNKTLRLLDLTCNNIGEQVVLEHATKREQEARQSRLAEIAKKAKSHRIDELAAQVEDRRKTAVWEDEKVELQALEEELKEERIRYTIELEEEKRKRKTKDAEREYRERIRETLGRELIDVDTPLRVILTGNASIQPTTLARLSKFYDTTPQSDYEAFLHAPRKFDQVIRPYRQPGEPQQLERPEGYNIFDFEDSVRLKERLEREKRTQEMDELRRKGLDATAILEERLRGPPKTPKTPGTGGSAPLTPKIHVDGTSSSSSDPAISFTPKGGSLLAPPIAAVGLSGTLLGTSGGPTRSPRTPRTTTIDVPIDSGPLISDQETSGTDGEGATPSRRSGGGRRATRKQRGANAALAANGAGAVITSVKAVAKPKKRHDDDEEDEDDDMEVDQFAYMDLGDDEPVAASQLFANLRQQLEAVTSTDQAEEAQARLEQYNAALRQRVDQRAMEFRSDGGLFPVDDPPPAAEDALIAMDVSGKLAMSASVTEEPMNRPAAVAETMATVYRCWATIRAIGERGSPSEEDRAQLQEETLRLSRFIGDVAVRFTEFSKSGPIALDDEQRVTAENFLDDIIKRTDIDPSAGPFVRSFVSAVELDYPSLCEQRGLLTVAATDASLQFMDVLLSIPDIRFDLPELLMACAYHQQHRCSLVDFLLKHPVSRAAIVANAEEIQGVWQEFFEDIASKKRTIPNEDRKKRDDLIKDMINLDSPAVACENDGADGHTAFSRACFEGDSYVVMLLSFSGKVTDINRRSPVTNMTPLMCAVVSNNADTVHALFDIGDEVDINAQCEDGTALDLAMALGRDVAIIEALKEHGAQPGPKTSPRGPKGGGAAAADGAKKPKPKGKKGASGRAR